MQLGSSIESNGQMQKRKKSVSELDLGQAGTFINEK
jgi:hypothetical protein